MAAIHHVGAVVLRDGDFEDAIRWWAELLDAEIAAREVLVSVPPQLMGLPPEYVDEIKVEGVQLEPKGGGSRIELHRFPEPADGAPLRRYVHDEGLGHLAITVPREDLESEGDRMAAMGIEWLGPQEEISDGALKGVFWRYGTVPRQYGGIRLELTWWPKVDPTT